MARDLTLIFSVMVSIISITFGIYKNVEAGNARGFAYEQTYRVLGLIADTNLNSSAKASLISTTLASLKAPPPVIDFSQSNASTPAEASACTPAVQTACIASARELAAVNAQCAKRDAARASCSAREQLVQEISQRNCITCFSQ